MKFKRNYLFIPLFAISLGFTACSDDDDNIDPDPILDPTGSLAVEDQMLESNMLTINNVSMSADGWVVIHRDNGSGGPMVPEIISVPQMVEAGESMDVMVQLKEGETVEDGETLWAMLHTDDGIIGTYEFNGSNGLDAPIMDEADNVVTQSFEVSVAPMGTLMVEDQEMTNNVVNVASVSFDRGGYVVIHASNDAGDGPMVPEIISEPVYLEAGTYTDVEVPLTSSANVEAGDTVWVMLHTDTGEEETYEFDGENGLDMPITDADGNVVVKPLTITSVTVVAITGSLSVEDQAVTDNQLNVGSVELSESGWVVVHASNEAGTGPMVPEIISEPMYLEAGTHEDVMVTFTESANVAVSDTVWVMLHNDTGVAEMYEFNGINGLDLPIIVDGNIVVTSVEITE
ncbi:DUF7282 domain-containing protein [Salinimicrobium oceani]|uniref:DUF7282 domain-containing protein n=1 Tax=Salinimicrobium oceani TaxID=2722702 RepID=A0ABX1CW12_9FLAO|nr:hypothetical protein [Salinimicrobium oceani]NJW52459.1 hypothetical protein [Salinimicrobium oceani]